MRADSNLLALLAAAPAAAWTSLSQARFGADASLIARNMRGEVENGYAAQRTLGYLCKCIACGHPTSTTLLSNASTRSTCSQYTICALAGSLPEDPLSDRGLGGGIAFAIDPTACERLKPHFHEDGLSIFRSSSFACGELEAAVHRAFTTWGEHHKLINFHECAPTSFYSCP